MPTELNIPDVDVAVTLLTCDRRIVLVFNRKWSTFTLPMTKRRSWQDPRCKPAHREEAWENAASRAAAECLGRTLTTAPAFLLDFPEFQQSDSDGTWKRYRFQIFELPLQVPNLHPSVMTEFLSVDEILDPSRQPISATARDLIKKLGEEERLP